MPFEATEKKLDIEFDSAVTGSLRSIEKSYWQELVGYSNTQILSSMTNKHCDAYLLSSSSLFVWENRLTLITCGQTRLVEPLFKLLERFPVGALKFLTYERKNEIYPHRQPTDFFSELKQLKHRLPGRAYRLGDESSQHVFLFHLDQPYPAPANDLTLEILMHGISKKTQQQFTANTRSTKIVDPLGLHSLIPGFEVDEHYFKPFGYSLNAIKDKYYYTIHVTPEEVGSYASFETSYAVPHMIPEISKNVLQIFEPQAYDVVLFQNCSVQVTTPPGYILRRGVFQPLSCSYNVEFNSYFKPDLNPITAYEINETEFD